MDKDNPVMRLNIWLESEDGLLFGHGRALLLRKIDENGSLRKAATDLKMSYRGAWGKIKKSEQALGFDLVEKAGGNKAGYRLTKQGRDLMERYFQWYETMEQQSLSLARRIFNQDIKPYSSDG